MMMPTRPDWRSTTWRPLSGLLTIALLATLASAQAAAQSWSPPATLGQSNLNFMYGNNVAVAVSSHPLAQSVAVWVEPTTMAVKYAIQRNGKWTGTKTVYTANANAAEEVTDPQVVIDQSGVATAIFGSTKQGPVTYCVSGGRVVRCRLLTSFAKVATLAPGASTWSKANLSAQGWTVTDAQIGLDQAGNAVAMWSHRATSASVPTLLSASRPAGGAWTAPVSVYTSSVISLPRLSVSPSGAAAAVWAEPMAGATTSYAVRASYRPAGSTWGAAETVATQTTPVAYLRSTVDGNGQAAVVWNNGYSVQLAQRNAAWSSPETLLSAPGRVYAGTGPYAAYGPSIASDGLGNVLVTWLEIDVLASAKSIEAELIPAAATRSHASWPTGAGVEPSVSLSPDGSLGMLAWLDEDDSNTYAVGFTPGAGWGQPLLMSSGAAQYAAVWGTGTALAAGPNQSATAVWLSVAGMYGQIQILASGYLP
jgi:hypothetical protein